MPAPASRKARAVSARNARCNSSSASMNRLRNGTSLELKKECAYRRGAGRTGTTRSRPGVGRPSDAAPTARSTSRPARRAGGSPDGGCLPASAHARSPAGTTRRRRRAIDPYATGARYCAPTRSPRRRGRYSVAAPRLWTRRSRPAGASLRAPRRGTPSPRYRTSGTGRRAYASQRWPQKGRRGKAASYPSIIATWINQAAICAFHAIGRRAVRCMASA